MARGATVFWSYAHSDDARDGGRIIALAENLQAEYSLLTGSDLSIFVDRMSLKWGDEWREKLDGALAESTFLIAVISPTYFARSECRREIEEFFDRAEKTGLAKRLLPLLYISVSDFQSDSPDRLVSVAAARQYVDWTTLRLSNPTSGKYRKAVNELARRILALSESPADPVLGSTLSLDVPSEAGLVDALERIETLLPAWLNTVEEDPVILAQYRAIDDTYTQRARRNAPSQRLAIMHRMAQDLLPLAERGCEAAREYVKLTVELEPAVNAAIAGANDFPDFKSALTPLESAIDEAMIAISGAEPSEGEMLSSEYWSAQAHLGRTFRTLALVLAESDALRDRGNAIVSGWDAGMSVVRTAAP